MGLASHPSFSMTEATRNRCSDRKGKASLEKCTMDVSRWKNISTVNLIGTRAGPFVSKRPIHLHTQRKGESLG